MPYAACFTRNTKQGHACRDTDYNLRSLPSPPQAKAELAMAKAEDPMPLRMAKIHQEAAVRKVTKATVKAGAATAAAETAAKLASEAREAAERAAVEASAAAKAAEEGEIDI